MQYLKVSARLLHILYGTKLFVANSLRKLLFQISKDTYNRILRNTLNYFLLFLSIEIQQCCFWYLSQYKLIPLHNFFVYHYVHFVLSPLCTPISDPYFMIFFFTKIHAGKSDWIVFVFGIFSFEVCGFQKDLFISSFISHIVSLPIEMMA